MQAKLIACLIALLMASVATADVRIETPDGTFRGEYKELTKDHIVLQIGTERRKFELKRVVSIRFAGTATKSRKTMIELDGGDRYYGTIAGGNLDSLELHTQSCGKIKIAGPLLTRIQFPIDPKAAKKIKITDHAEKDVIYLKNGDYVTGRMNEMKPRKGGGFDFSLVKSDDETETVASNDIYRIKLSPYEKAKKTTKFHAIVSCWDGSRVQVDIRSVASRILTTKSVADASVERKIPISAIRSIRFKNGAFVYLTDLEPSKIEDTPFFDFRFPPEFDRCRRGRKPLRLRGREYAKGIGMQARTRVTYKLDASYSQFRCLVGIDDQAGDGGSVIFRVYLNGKKVHETKVLRGGQPLVPIKVALKPGDLTLEADYADNAHVNDLADWVNTILLK